MSDAIGGMGIQVRRAGVAIAELKGVSGIGIEIGTWDATVHSTSDYWTKVRAGLKTLKPITLELNFLPAAATHGYAAGGLVNDFDNRTRATWSLVFPDSGSTTWSFDAFPSDLSIDAPTSEGLTGSVTLQPTGESVTLA